jgi:hypothetical protein
MAHAVDVPQARQVVGIATDVEDHEIVVLKTLENGGIARRTLRRT